MQRIIYELMLDLQSPFLCLPIVSQLNKDECMPLQCIASKFGSVILTIQFCLLLLVYKQQYQELKEMKAILAQFALLAVAILQATASGLRNLQFSHFVPGYLLGIPTQFLNGINSVTGNFDPYAQSQAISSTVGIGSNLRNTVEVVCSYPLVFINGGCQCPGGGRYILGRCIGGSNFQSQGQQTNSQQTNSQQTNSQTNSQPTNSQNNLECPLGTVQRISNYYSIQGLALHIRNIDGSQNNLQFPSWGSTDSFLQRRAPNTYEDGIGQPATYMPTARAVSNEIGPQKNVITTSRFNGTAAITFFGQFLDHDLDLTVAQGNDNNVEHMNIQIPPNDPFFFDRKQIEFTRSKFVNGSPRKHRNAITSWIDGNQVYGSTPLISCMLRSFKNGKLKTSGDNLLPKFDGFYRAGDIRAIENAILASYHTLFMREHNRICDRVLSQNPSLNDETVFQIARNYVIGLLQKITFKEFLPILLGSSYDRVIGPYQGYKPNINPNIPIEFSTAAFRIGHPLLVSKFPLLNSQWVQYSSVSLSQLFFNQEILTSANISGLIRGLCQTKMKEKSGQIINDVRNLLVLDPSRREIKLDLFSLNIQRGRDHGLAFYNSARLSYGLPRVERFEEILPFDSYDLIPKLEELYGNPDFMDLFVGIIVEKPLLNAVLGELGSAIVGQTFRNLRDGDRFWYESNYPSAIVDEIERTTLSDIFRRNSEALDLPKDMFHYNR